MKIKNCILFFVILLLGSSFKQQKADFIYWDRNTNLKWEDFQGTPDQYAEKSSGAATNSSIKYKFSRIKDTAYVQVHSVFYKSISWKKDNSELNEYTLKHEQSHFDITEIYSRKFRKVIKTTKLYESGIKNDLKVLFERITKECDIVQDTYDKETEHSKNRIKQIAWDKKIAEELKSLEAYGNPELKLSLTK